MSDHSTHDEEFVGHEETDADIGPLVKFAIFLTVFTLAAAVATVGFYKFLDSRELSDKAPKYPMTVGVERPLPPAPRLQTYPFQDVKTFRQEEAQLLEHYSWVDKNAGTVRIPVSRAIDLLAERGLPHRAASSGAEAPPPQGPSGAEAPPPQIR
jgi:hypothetical protein